MEEPCHEEAYGGCAEEGDRGEPVPLEEDHETDAYEEESEALEELDQGVESSHCRDDGRPPGAYHDAPAGARGVPGTAGALSPQASGESNEAASGPANQPPRNEHQDDGRGPESGTTRSPWTTEAPHRDGGPRASLGGL